MSDSACTCAKRRMDAAAVGPGPGARKSPAWSRPVALEIGESDLDHVESDDVDVVFVLSNDRHAEGDP